MIHFVGAGCGAKDLITVRGMRLIEEAELIIYAGSLVNTELLSYNRKNAAVYNSAEMTLDEVMDIMIPAAKEGSQIVRLHSGDPSLYGAIGEQMRLLDKEGIAYDVCPGVTAAFGAAAALKREFTLPSVTQTLIFTRAKGRTEVPDRESIEKLSAHQSTMAVYLSASLAGELMEELIKGGYPKDTPVAICYKVSWPDEKLIECRLDELGDKVSENGLYMTALFLIGRALKETDFNDSRLYAPDFSTGFRKAQDK